MRFKRGAFIIDFNGLPMKIDPSNGVIDFYTMPNGVTVPLFLMSNGEPVSIIVYNIPEIWKFSHPIERAEDIVRRDNMRKNNKRKLIVVSFERVDGEMKWIDFNTKISIKAEKIIDKMLAI